MGSKNPQTRGPFSLPGTGRFPGVGVEKGREEVSLTVLGWLRTCPLTSLCPSCSLGEVTTRPLGLVGSIDVGLETPRDVGRDTRHRQVSVEVPSPYLPYGGVERLIHFRGRPRVDPTRGDRSRMFLVSQGEHFCSRDGPRDGFGSSPFSSLWYPLPSVPRRSS